MQYKMTAFVNILVFALIACNMAPVFSRSNQYEKCSGCADGKPKIETNFSFNACRFPTDDQNAETAIVERDSKFVVSERFQTEIHKTTEEEIDFISEIIRAERQVRCKHQLHQLKRKQLEDVIQSYSTANFEKVNSNITETYLKIATLAFLLNHLDSDLSLAAEECCLSYTSEIHHRLRNRMLKYWYSIQDMYGDSIDGTQCEVRVNIKFNMLTGCDNIRDIICLLLQHARDVLNHSKSVRPGHKRN